LQSSRDYADALGSSPLPVACITPHLIQGKITVPQSGTFASLAQRLVPMTTERASVQKVTELFEKMLKVCCSSYRFESDSCELSDFKQDLGRLCCSSFSRMIAGALCQGLHWQELKTIRRDA
jgi:hypothetical protein